MTSELPAEYYDEFHGVDAHYSKNYRKSRYYALFRAILKELNDIRPSLILEVGCGSGVLAQMLQEQLPSVSYRGFDFSRTAVGRAGRRTGRQDMFFVADARSAAAYESDYDAIVCTEVLEHIEDDLDVIRNWRPGTPCICSVPNFLNDEHVRCFRHESEVCERYGDLLSISKVRRVATPVMTQTGFGDYLRRLRWSRNDPRKLAGLLGINRFNYLAGWFMFAGTRRAD
ncbi:MAG: class I SAM-dependent methyltransferase [Acetobacteraceae bacterium]